MTDTRPTSLQLRLPVLVAALLAIAMNSAAGAATWTVDDDGPADHASIGSALAVAATGDTIRVLPGAYTGPANLNLDFAGRDLVLISRDGAESTIIDGQGAGRFLWFQGGETAASLVRGFTITGCSTSGPLRVTGGSSPRIRDCIICGNNVTGDGGGVYIAGASPDLRDCTIVENDATGHGAGIAVNGGAPVLNRLAIVGNRAVGRGGGVWAGGGAVPSLTSCTISSNVANTAGGAFDGGGVAVTGPTAAVIARSILWGNHGSSTDDLLAGAGASVQVNCSLVDSLGSGGPGSITRDAATRSVSPRFCAPDYGGQSPWSEGLYTVAANSPAAPAHSPCGQLLGALPVACGDITVWTGGAGTQAWGDAANWSSGAVPGPGEVVQLTRGNVTVGANAAVRALYQVSEDSSPDTLTVTGGAVLQLGASPAAAKVEPDKAIRTEVVKVLDGEILFPCPEHCPGGSGPPRAVGLWILGQAAIRGQAVLQLLGNLTVVPGGNAEIEMPLEILAGGILQVNGDATLLRTVTNAGQVVVGSAGSLTIDDMFTNAGGGELELAGDLNGIGTLANQGVVTRAGPGISVVNLPLFNQRDLGLGQPGQLSITGGVLQWAVPTINEGLVTVADGATLALDAAVDNGALGRIELGGDLGGSHALLNHGTLECLGTGSVISNVVTNALDPLTGEPGILLVSSGSVDIAGLANQGTTAVLAGAMLSLTGPSTNEIAGTLAGTGTIDFSAASLTNLGRIAPGLSPGRLTLVGSFNSPAGSRLEVEIAGPAAGAGHDQLLVEGSADLAGALVVRVADDYQYAIGDTFTVARVVSGVMNSSPTCLAGTQMPGRPLLLPVAQADRLLLVASPQPPANAPPVAVADTIAVPPGTPTVLPLLANDFDPEGSPLAVAWIQDQPQHGTIVLSADGAAVTYHPPAGGGEVDHLTYVVSDCAGAIAQATVRIEPAWVSPAPLPAAGSSHLHPIEPNPANPAAVLRYDLGKPGRAQLTVHDVRGRLVAVLHDGFQEAGAHVATWRGRDTQGRDAPSGVYLARLQWTDGATVRKFILLR